MVSEIFEPKRWREVEGFSFTDITYHRAVDGGTVRVAFNRPEVRNAFRPHTVDELYQALDHARMSSDVGCVLLTGNGPSPKDGGWAFCSGGDQRIRGRDGYRYADGETAETIDPARSGRLHIMEVHRLIRFMPKVVICVVPGWAAGGGHSLHVVCDLTLASREHARFKQTDADVGSFDGGFGSAYLARQVGQKFAREIFFLGETYDAPRRTPDGHGQRGGAARRPGAHRAGVGRQDQRQEPHLAADAEVLVQHDRRRAGGPAGARGRGDPARLHDRRGGRGPGRLPGEARPGLDAFPLVLLTGWHRRAGIAERRTGRRALTPQVHHWRMPLFAFEGREPAISPAAWIAPTATLVGDVHVEAEASVWYGAVLRADFGTIVVRRGANVQDGSVLHGGADPVTEVGEGATIGHLCVVHGAVIGAEALVGNGATVLDGAVVGPRALVAAGATVPPGMTIPGGMLAAGVPARVVREISGGARQWVEHNPEIYRALARRHAPGSGPASPVPAPAPTAAG